MCNFDLTAFFNSNFTIKNMKKFEKIIILKTVDMNVEFENNSNFYKITEIR